MPEAHFDFEIKKRKHFFSLDEDLAEMRAKITRAMRIPANTLSNEWLREKVMEVYIIDSKNIKIPFT